MTAHEEKHSSGRSGEILQVFTRFVAERGYDNTNIGDIAAKLGISKGTVVHHYGNKDYLLAALHESYMRRRTHEAELIMQRLRTPVDQLAGLMYAFIFYQVHERAATVAFQREVAKLADRPSLAEGVRLRSEYMSRVRSIAEAGVQEGQLRDTDLHTQTLLLFGAAQWAWTWFDPNGEESAEQVGAALVDLVLGSLLVSRDELGPLADPHGTIPPVVWGCLTAS